MARKPTRPVVPEGDDQPTFEFPSIHERFLQELESAEPPKTVKAILKSMGMTPDEVREMARDMFKKEK